MSQVKIPEAAHPERTIVISRHIHAAKECVYAAWTETALIEKWWAPRGYSTKVPQNDLRVGGMWRYEMTGADGAAVPCVGTYQEVVPGERVTTTVGFEPTFKKQAGIDLADVVATTYFTDNPLGGMDLTLHLVHPTTLDKAKYEQMGVAIGWQSSFDKLQEQLDREAILQAMARWRAAVENRDMEALVAAYAPEVMLFDLKPPYKLVGPAAVRADWEACLPYFPKKFWIRHEDAVLTVGGDAAFVYGLVKIDPIGEESRAGDQYLRFTVCFQRIGGKWRVTHEHVSTPVNPVTNAAVWIKDKNDLSVPDYGGCK